MLPLSKARKTEPDGRRVGHPLPVAGLRRGVDAGYPGGQVDHEPFVGSGEVDGQECRITRVPIIRAAQDPPPTSCSAATRSGS
jgi:hypothetical protein